VTTDKAKGEANKQSTKTVWVPLHNATRPAESYNDAFFANIRALYIEHPNVLEEWLGAMDRPMEEIVTCEGDLGISPLTNRSGETTACG
jgi:hypothetical protein